MKLHIRMPAALKPYFRQELLAFKEAFAAMDLATAWRHLERAHVIGQAWPWQHTYAHWRMFCFGVAIKSPKEVLGQIPRLLVGGVKSFVGKIPLGNTGGSGAHPLRPMAVPVDLQAILEGKK